MDFTGSDFSNPILFLPGWPTILVNEMTSQLKGAPKDFSTVLFDPKCEDVMGLQVFLMEAKSADSQQLLHDYVLSKRPQELAELLTKRSIEVDVADSHGMTALQKAVAGGDLEIVELLLQAGAKPNASTGDVPLLHVAVGAENNLKMIKRLLEKGADAEAADGQGQTVLHLAAKAGLTAVITLLISHRETVKGFGQSWVSAIDKDGNTALHYALMNHKIETVMALIKRGADANTKNSFGWTALHCAVMEGHTMLVKLLLRKGANIDSPDNEGMTPLHVAARQTDEEIAELLLESKANPLALDALGRMPGDFFEDKPHADLRKRERLLELLTEARKRVQPDMTGEDAPKNTGLVEIKESTTEAVAEKPHNWTNDQLIQEQDGCISPVSENASQYTSPSSSPDRKISESPACIRAVLEHKNTAIQQNRAKAAPALADFSPPIAFASSPRKPEDSDVCQEEPPSDLESSPKVMHFCKYCHEPFQRQALGGHTKICKHKNGILPSTHRRDTAGVHRPQRSRPNRSIASDTNLPSEVDGVARTKKIKLEGESFGEGDLSTIAIGITRVKKYISRIGNVTGLVVSKKTLRNGQVTYTVQYDTTGDIETMTELQVERHKVAEEDYLLLNGLGLEETPIKRPETSDHTQTCGEHPSSSTVPLATTLAPPPNTALLPKRSPKLQPSREKSKLQSLLGHNKPNRGTRTKGTKRPRPEGPAGIKIKFKKRLPVSDHEAAATLAALGGQSVREGRKPTPEKEAAAAVLSVLHSRAERPPTTNPDIYIDSQRALHNLTDLLLRNGAFTESSILSEAFQHLDHRSHLLQSELQTLKNQHQEFGCAVQSEVQVVDNSLHLLREAFGALEGQVIQNKLQLSGLHQDMLNKDRLLLQLTKQLDDSKKVNLKLQSELWSLQSTVQQQEIAITELREKMKDEI